MNILWPINTLGPIFVGPIFLSTFLAFFVCFKASRPGSSPKVARRAFIYSLLPFGISIVAACSGLLLIAVTGDSLEKGGGWWAVFKTTLVGFVLTVVPLIWSLLIMRSGKGTAPTTA